MTISLSKKFYSFLIFAGCVSGAMADEAHKPVEVLAGGKSFSSFEAYAAYRSPELLTEPLTQEVPVPVFTQDVLGITSPLDQIWQDFQRPGLAGRPVCLSSSLAEVIGEAVDGKQGPLLLVADEHKVRIMELKPEDRRDTNLGTKP